MVFSIYDKLSSDTTPSVIVIECKGIEHPWSFVSIKPLETISCIPRDNFTGHAYS
jgi:hypothetical protein